MNRMSLAILVIVAITRSETAASQVATPPVRPGGYAERASARPSLVPSAAADSLYTSARRHLNQARYDSAIAAFRLVGARYPLAYVAPNAWYWVAYSHNRRGMEKAGASGVADLRAARDALIVHRLLYEDSPTRSDAIELIFSNFNALVARGAASPADSAVRWYGQASNFDPCSFDVIRREGPAPESLRTLQTDAGALRPGGAATELTKSLDATLQGGGLCLDVAPLESVYEQLGNRVVEKQIVIAAFGRSLHPAASRQLGRIARGESQPELAELARSWLKFRGEPPPFSVR